MTQSYDDRMKLLVDESNKTMSDLEEKLNEFGRCLCIRPTGFGKTYLLVKLAERYIEKYPDKKVMYVLPSNIIETEIRHNSSYNQELINKYFVFVTYQALAKSVGDSGTAKSRDKYFNLLKDCSVCLLDEVHRSAADGYATFYSYTEEFYSKDKVHLVGVTATPLRADEEESEWIFNILFEEHQTYEYSLWNAIDSGLLLKPIYSMAKFQVEDEYEERKREIKKAHMEANGYFNEKEFETSFNKAYRSNGTESEVIYKAIKKAGYNLSSSNPDDSYLKFIVFFSNTQELAEHGEETERWFFDAIEKEASKDYNTTIKFSKHVDYVISSTADQNNDNIIRKHAEEESYRNCIYDASTVGDNDVYKGQHIDLIFNVNVITMGYHVDHISGIMMRRGTGTDIMYFQQLGRCFSVKAMRPSIIFDLAKNKQLQKNRDMKRGNDRDTNKDIAQKTLIERVPNETVERNISEAFVVDFESGIDDLFTKWQDTDTSYISRVRYLYEDRNMPIALIAQDTNLSCLKVAQFLNREGVVLRSEDSMVAFLNKGNQFDKEVVNTKTNEFKLLAYLNSKKADSIFKRLKIQTTRKYNNFFKLVVSLLGGK